MKFCVFVPSPRDRQHGQCSSHALGSYSSRRILRLLGRLLGWLWFMYFKRYPKVVRRCASPVDVEKLLTEASLVIGTGFLAWRKTFEVVLDTSGSYCGVCDARSYELVLWIHSLEQLTVIFRCEDAVWSHLCGGHIEYGSVAIWYTDVTANARCST